MATIPPAAVYRTFRLGSRYLLQFPWYGVELADIRSSSSVQEQLREDSGSDTPQRDTRAAHFGMARVYQTRAELLRANLKTFILDYLILDLLEVIVNHDPYFWGIPDRPLPTSPPY